LDAKYQVYLLENSVGRHYIGLSEDVAARLAQHNSGESKWTAKYRPWKSAWVSRFLTLSDARRLENILKRQKGGDGINSLLRDFAGS
jgi:putative endonuclease